MNIAETMETRLAEVEAKLATLNGETAEAAEEDADEEAYDEAKDIAEAEEVEREFLRDTREEAANALALMRYSRKHSEWGTLKNMYRQMEEIAEATYDWADKRLDQSSGGEAA